MELVLRLVCQLLVSNHEKAVERVTLISGKMFNNILHKFTVSVYFICRSGAGRLLQEPVLPRDHRWGARAAQNQRRWGRTVNNAVLLHLQLASSRVCVWVTELYTSSFSYKPKRDHKTLSRPRIIVLKPHVEACSCACSLCLASDATAGNFTASLKEHTCLWPEVQNASSCQPRNCRASAFFLFHAIQLINPLIWVFP